MKITGIILAGGNSSRMRREKALVAYKGKKLIEWSILVLNRVCDRMVISSNNPALSSYGYPIIKDEYDNIGPIAGLYSTLKGSGAEHHAVIPCDTPLLTTTLYKTCLKNMHGYQAVIASPGLPKIEPLIGYYHRSAVSVLENQIENRDYKLANALEQMKTKIEIFKDQKLFTNINQPNDLY